MRKIDKSKLIDAETVLTEKYGAPGSESRKAFDEKRMHIITASSCATDARS